MYGERSRISAYPRAQDIGLGTARERREPTNEGAASDVESPNDESDEEHVNVLATTGQYPFVGVIDHGSCWRSAW